MSSITNYISTVAGYCDVETSKYELQKCSDKRTKVMKEIIESSPTISYYAMEALIKQIKTLNKKIALLKHLIQKQEELNQRAYTPKS